MFYVTRAALEQIENLARQGFPYEICGFLGGSATGVGQEVRVARNIALSREVEYNINPEETLATLLDFERRGFKITAVYHSHPRYPARPSGVDLKLADLPDACYLITSVNEAPEGGLSCLTRAWNIKRGKASPVELIVKE
ncbi:MAG TPA: M67 family metallopeptidase [Chloroflexia bacterium]|nr:M67 family metallopeptidase [Chloroflexia bacterium]